MPDLAKRPFFRDHARLIAVGGAKGAYFELIQPAISEIVQRSTAFRICTLRDHGSPPQYDFSTDSYLSHKGRAGGIHTIL